MRAQTGRRRRWRFGIGQEAREELREIQQARASGMIETYLAGQQYARMIVAETERRRQRSDTRAA